MKCLKLEYKEKAYLIIPEKKRILIEETNIVQKGKKFVIVKVVD